MTDKPADVSTSAWILDHVLALLTIGSFVYLWWFASHFDLSDLNAEVDPTQLPLRIIAAGTWSIIAAIVFWVRMYHDFFRHRPARHAAAWGTALFIGAHLTALVYFAVIWRPRVAAQRRRAI